jgi:predicted nuclease with RNAse H fold
VAVLTGEKGARPQLLALLRLPEAKSPSAAEAALWAVVEEHSPAVLAVDAPLTLPPCVRCRDGCAGGPDGCKLEEAHALWKAGGNPTSQRLCEREVHVATGVRPIPTMRLGVIAGRGIALARRAANATPGMQLLEVYPRASLHRLSAALPDLAPPIVGETAESFRGRVARAFEASIDGIGDPSTWSAHEVDALVSAYTGWLFPERLVGPPANWAPEAGWIYYPA